MPRKLLLDTEIIYQVVAKIPRFDLKCKTEVAKIPAFVITSVSVRYVIPPPVESY